MYWFWLGWSNFLQSSLVWSCVLELWLKQVLITYQCLGVAEQALWVSRCAPARRLRVCKRLESDTARTPDPSWPKGHSIPQISCLAIQKKCSLSKDFTCRLAGHQSACGRWRIMDCLCIICFYFFFFLLHLLNCLYLNPQVPPQFSSC